jgi:hypothetical protein
MRPSLRLPPGKTVLDVADASRDALEEFLALDADDKLALSQWLIGSYRRAVSFAPKAFHTPSPHGRAGTVAQLSLSSVVEHAQQLLDTAISRASEPGAEALLALMPEIVDVVPVHDSFGGRGFAPQDASNAKLATRVLTLLLADYLTRADDYVAKRGPGKARRPSVRMLALG